MGRHRESEKRAVTVNEVKLIWLELRLEAANEVLKQVGRRLPAEVQGTGPTQATLRKVRTIALALTILGDEIEELAADMRKGVGLEPALRSYVNRLMGVHL